MPNITVYLTEEQYVKWVTLDKKKRKDFLGWAIESYKKQAQWFTT